MAESRTKACQDAFGDSFKRSEFACRCGCGFDTVDGELLEILKTLREHFNAPVKIQSGARCATHNKNVGGADNSQHVYGRAADIAVSGIAPSAVYAYLVSTYPHSYGVGLYNSWVHIDTRKQKARWGS